MQITYLPKQKPLRSRTHNFHKRKTRFSDMELSLCTDRGSHSVIPHPLHLDRVVQGQFLLLGRSNTKGLSNICLRSYLRFVFPLSFSTQSRVTFLSRGTD